MDGTALLESEPAEVADASSARGGVAESEKAGNVQTMLAVRSLDGEPEPLGGKDGREVEKRPVWGRDRDAVALGAVLVGKVAGAVDDDPAAPPDTESGQQHVDEAAGAVDEPPEERSGEMAEDCRLAGREDGGHQVTLAAEATVTNRVDAEMETVKTTGGAAAMDEVEIDAEREDLDAGDDPVLTAGDPCQDPPR